MARPSSYAFVTRWTIPAAVDVVWKELTAPEQWPVWWRGVERVEMLREGGASGVGAVRRYTFRSRLPYRLTFDMETIRVDEQRLIEGRASGELDGRGCWRLEPKGAVTEVRYDWDVETTKLWMRLAGPLARPIFAWNHDIVMAWGREGLERRVRC